MSNHLRYETRPASRVVIGDTIRNARTTRNMIVRGRVASVQRISSWVHLTMTSGIVRTFNADTMIEVR